jgi:hypothetical protein
MKRAIRDAALVVLVLATITGCTIHTDGGEAVTGMSGSDFFGAGGIVNLTDAVPGDAMLAGGRVSVASEVEGDLVVTGGELSIGGAVGDDLYSAGGSVQLDAIVSGNARVAGGDVTVGPATVVAGTLSIHGGRVLFEGNTHSDLRVTGGSVRLNGEVHGDAEVRAEELLIGPDARIGGRLVFHGPVAPEVPETAVIAGGVELHPEDSPRWGDHGQPRVRDAVRGVGSFLWFVGVFVAAALFVLLFPRFAKDASAAIGAKPLQSLGLGLAILLCVPFVGVVLLITIIGIPLALLLVPLYVLVLFLGWATAALFIAQRGLDALRPARAVTPAWQLLALLLGLLALWLVRQVPYLGGMVGFLALIAGIGALVWQALNGRRAATA